MNEENEFDLDFDSICETIHNNDYKTILLQFPDGLRHMALEAAHLMEERTKASVLIWADSCYGACDLPSTGEGMKLDLIVHFGHAKMPPLKSDVPIIFMETHSKIEVIPIVKKALGWLSKKVGIITTVQHIHKLNEVKKFLLENGLDVHIGKAGGRITYDGQVLGCNLASATTISHKVDCFLYIGGGNFHPIGVALATKKPVIVADPIQDEVRAVEEIKEKLLRQRFGAITKAKDADSFGIIVSTKPGQMRMDTALELKMMADRHDKKAFIIVTDEISPEKLMGLDIESYVSCACPRIAIDDLMRYKSPILTPFEFRIVCNEKKWEDYTFDSLF